MLTDYERVSKVVSIRGAISFGGSYFSLSCYIEKLITIGEPQKIKFKFYLRESSGFGEMIIQFMMDSHFLALLMIF